MKSGILLNSRIVQFCSGDSIFNSIHPKSQKFRKISRELNICILLSESLHQNWSEYVSSSAKIYEVLNVVSDGNHSQGKTGPPSPSGGSLERKK